MAILGAGLAMVGVLSGPMARALSPTEPFALVSMRSHVVRHGDTLWSIASALSPEADPREVIEDIERLNPRASSFLMPGQRLVIPSRG